MAAAEMKITLQDVVSPEKLKPNPWNTNVVSPENERRIEESIKRLGFFRPVIVRELQDGTLQILGGQHRWEAAKRLGLKGVPIFNLKRISDQKAQEIGLADNGRYGEDDPAALSALLKGLGTAEELSTFLPYTDIDLTNIFAASSIDIDQLGLDGSTEEKAPASTKPPATHQVMRFKVPVEKIAVVTERIEQVMRTKNFTADDSLTNAGNALVHILES